LVATAALVVSCVAATGVSTASAQPTPSAEFEVRTPGTVDYAFFSSSGMSGANAVLLLEAPAVCPQAFTPVGTGYYVVFDGDEDAAFTFATGSPVQMRGSTNPDPNNPSSPVPLPDGRYQFCALWESNMGDIDTLAEVEAEIGVPEPTPPAPEPEPAPEPTPQLEAIAATPAFTG
jgi:hypothetical protein